MLPFTVSLRPGDPIHEQVTYAVTKAIVSGQLRPGDPFPSVRTLSQELRINPNTAHKAVTALVDQGLLVVRPGVGTVVESVRPGSARGLFDHDTERLVVEARQSGLSLYQVLAAVRRHWIRIVGRTA
jgi:GntR family transcriptional regulator